MFIMCLLIKNGMNTMKYIATYPRKLTGSPKQNLYGLLPYFMFFWYLTSFCMLLFFNCYKEYTFMAQCLINITEYIFCICLFITHNLKVLHYHYICNCHITYNSLIIIMYVYDKHTIFHMPNNNSSLHLSK